MNDDAIVNLFWQRSQEAIFSTQEKYGRLIRSVCTGILADTRDAEEAIADTYLRMWNNIPPNRPENLKAYTLRISRHAALDLLRTKNRGKRDSRCEILFSELDQCLPDPGNPFLQLEEEELVKAINGYLRTLDVTSRTLFIRRYFSLEELDALSTSFGMKKPVITARLYRIRKGLRKFLRKEGIPV